MVRPQLIALRAFSQVGRPIKYKLGAGGREPLALSPADHDGLCDCSGFVSWCVGLDRYQPRSLLLVKFNGGWISTSAIVFDALHPRSESGWFTRIERPELGCVVAYPDTGKGKAKKQGHTGIVSAFNFAGPGSLKVIHCSSSNSRRGPAVQETRGEFFLAHQGVTFARFDPAEPSGPAPP